MENQLHHAFSSLSIVNFSSTCKISHSRHKHQMMQVATVCQLPWATAMKVKVVCTKTLCRQPDLNHGEGVRNVRVEWTGPFHGGDCNSRKKITWYLIGHAARHLIVWADRILSQISHTSSLKYRRTFSCDSTKWSVWEEMKPSTNCWIFSYKYS